MEYPLYDKDFWKQFSRIAIFGCSGAGKSTFALHLHKLLGLPLHHVDRYYYLEHWQERPYDEYIALQQKIIDQDRWIFDGNGIHSGGLRYARSEIFFYFNYPRRICYWRAFKRWLRRNPELQDRSPLCPEIFFFWKFLSYIWTFRADVAPGLQELRIKHPHVLFVEIRSDEDMIHLEERIKKVKHENKLCA